MNNRILNPWKHSLFALCIVLLLILSINPGMSQNNPFIDPAQQTPAQQTLPANPTPSTASPFGSATTQAPSASPFGSTPATPSTSPFAAAQPSTGQPPMASTGASPFGSTTTQAPSASPFGSTPATASTSPFGAAQPSTGQPPMASTGAPPFDPANQASSSIDSSSTPFGATQPKAGLPPFEATIQDSPAMASEVIPAPGETTAQPPSMPDMSKKEVQFSEGMPPMNISASPTIASMNPANPSTNYFENLEEGKKAIQNLKKSGVVFLTNPIDEDNQRIERILGLSQFRNLLSNMVFIKLDVDKDPMMLSHYGIYKTPSIVLYDSKGLLRKKIQSISDMNYLLQEIQNLQ
jgi:hypothetical protein